MLIADGDHVGNLPYLNAENGFHGKIFSSYKTIEIAKKLLEDSVNIHEKTVQKLKVQGRKTRPLYTKQQMFEMFSNMESIPMNKKIELDSRVTIMLLPNNHCYGSVMIKLWIKKLNGQVVSLVYTGDLGSKYNQEINPFNEVRDTIPKANYIICEGTYNNLNRTLNKQIVKDDLKRFKDTIRESLMNGERVLISSFSFNKGQYLPLLIYRMFKDEEWFNYNMVIDGVLIHKINDVYLRTVENKELLQEFKEMLNWHKTKVIKTQDSTNAFLLSKEPSIVITTSGFLSQGRIVTYLLNYLGSSKCTCMFTGFFGAEGSIGYRIVNPKQKTVSIEGQTILKRAKIFTFGNAFSGHIQSNEIVNDMKGVNCDTLFIHHSEGEGKYELADKIREESRNCNNTKKVIAVDKDNYIFDL